MTQTITCDYCGEVVDDATGMNYLSVSIGVPQASGTPQMMRLDLHNECAPLFAAAATEIHGDRPSVGG